MTMKKELKLRSIAEEAAACREAFKGFPVGGLAFHCHHDLIDETLIEDTENCIAYILSSKPQYEQALRLRLFRPVHKNKLKVYAEWEKANAGLNKANAEWEKAYMGCTEADAERRKAYIEWYKADAELGELAHERLCVEGCPWNGKTIFPA